MQETKEDTFTKEEIEMQKLVSYFKESLSNRDHIQAQADLLCILGNLEPLNYWLPYKDLAKLLTERCTEEEVPLLSEAEIAYLKEIADKLGDKNSNVGLGTIPLFYSRLEDLKAERQISRLGCLKETPMDDNALESIVFPEGWESKIREFRQRPKKNREDKILGLWNTWDVLSEIASKSAESLDNIIKSGIDSSKTEKYFEEFMGENLYTNVFQCRFDDGQLAHLAKVFRLYLILMQREGLKPEEMPGFVEKRIRDYIDKKGDVTAWKGVKEFTMMHISNVFAEEKFLGAGWKVYDPMQQCIDWSFEYIEKGDFEKAEYIVDIADQCCRKRNVFWLKIRKRFYDSVMEFTGKFAREEKIDKELGNSIYNMYRVFRKLQENFEMQLKQPYTHIAVLKAAELGHDFAKGIIEDLSRNEMSMFDVMMISSVFDTAVKMNKTPYVDYSANETAEEIGKRLVESGIFKHKDYILGSVQDFREAVENGDYISAINECNTSLQNIEELKKKAEELRQKREESTPCDTFIYVSGAHVFAYNGENIEIYVAMPKDVHQFIPMAGLISSSWYRRARQDESVYRITVKFEDDKRKEKLNMSSKRDQILRFYIEEDFKVPLICYSREDKETPVLIIME